MLSSGNRALKASPRPACGPGGVRDDSSDSIVAKFGRYCFDGCVPFTKSTYSAVIASRDIALTASQIVYGGDRAAFALCRPPGHHTGPNYAGDYCFRNNAAIAAQWLRYAGAERVAILISTTTTATVRRRSSTNERMSPLYQFMVTLSSSTHITPATPMRPGVARVTATT